MHQLTKIVVLLTSLLLNSVAFAGKLAIVIDDFGYRPHQEKQVLQMPSSISVAVLPNAPYARQMAIAAHQQGHEVLIHLPMAPFSKQPLEKDTLQPEMSEADIARIIHNAVSNVPYAVGLNNHMGSKMTSSLPAMQKVMHVLANYSLYFLDSMTIAGSQATRAAEGTGVRVIKRRVFLDDNQNEPAIRQQFQRAVHLAQQTGSAIAIGHPHPTTIRVLQQMLPSLPADITLVSPGQLIGKTTHNTVSTSPAKQPQKPLPVFHGNGLCLTPHPLAPVPASRALEIVEESIMENLSDAIHHLF